ncbi:MAG: hypothetical protein IT316_15080 [Anaerolineales bacterium]|nr:hypothetical protein [Anaerolineales bacterium]
MKRRFLMIGLVILSLAASALACSFSFSSAKVENLRLASDEAGANPTTTFGQEDNFYLLGDLKNAPDDTLLKAVWIAVDAQGVDPNTTIDEVELKNSGGPFTFSLEKNMPLWPPGSYRVDLYLDDKLNQSVDFTVEQTVQAELQGLSLALDAQGSQPASVFAPDADVYLTGELVNATAATPVRVVWSAVSLLKPQSPDDTLALSQGVVKDDTQDFGSGPVSFSFPRDGKLMPPGQYSADVYLHDTLVKTLTFEVEGAQPASADNISLALDEDGNSPVTSFSPQDKFYLVADIANAPAAGVPVKVVWTAVDVEGDTPSNSEIDTYENSVGNGSFWCSLTSNTGEWPLGTYRVDLYLDEALVKTIDFQVGTQGGAAPPAGVTAVTDVYMARDAEGEQDTNVFAPSEAVVLVGTLVNAPQGAQVEAIWKADNVAGRQPDEEISIPKSFTFNEGLFSISLTSDTGSLVKGEYKVDLQLNGETVETRYFLVTDIKIVNPYMATDDTGDTRTTIYKTEQLFYVHFTLVNAPADTGVTTKWYKLGDKAGDHVQINDSSYTFGSGDFYVRLSPNSGVWEAGSYVVDLYLNDYFCASVYFEVQ